MTEKLYYRDPYRTEFTAQLVHQEKIDTPDGPRWLTEISATCFYPEGGGQPSDRGTLNNREVLEVRKDGERVLHLLRSPLDQDSPEVFGRIEPMHRRHFMQQHTGQHILSAVLHRSCSYATRSVHLGEKYTSIEIEGTGITPFEIIQVEDEANRIICENRHVRGYFVDKEDLSSIQLRRSLKTGTDIRIVEIDGLDQVGCGGVHLERTGEARLIKHLYTETVRGNSRLYFAIGDAAAADYREKSRITSRLTELLSAPQEELLVRLDEFVEKSGDKDRRISSLLKQLNARTAADLYADGETAGETRIVTAEIPEEEADQLREIGEALAAAGPVFLALTVHSPKGLRWVIAAPDPFPDLFPELKEQLLPLIKGKGGGRPPFWQGAGENPRGIPAFFETFRAEVRKRAGQSA